MPMKQFSRIMLVGLGFGLLALVLSSIPNTAAAAPSASSVVVVNTAANPIPTVNVGDGSPITALLCVSTNQTCSSNSYTVPSGSHLIIDYTSGRCVLFTGGAGNGTATAYDPELNFTQGGTLFSHSLAPALVQQSTSSGLVFSWAQ